jgi:hypothetical protein
MSRPNTSNDPQAPLLTGDPPSDDTDTEEHSGSKQITIFRKTFNLFHLIVVAVGVLALTAIGVSIAAIGIPTLYILRVVLSVEHRGDSNPRHRGGNRKTHDNVCLTPECVQLSADILRSFGDADPCEDFYDCISSFYDG